MGSRCQHPMVLPPLPLDKLFVCHISTSSTRWEDRGQPVPGYALPGPGSALCSQCRQRSPGCGSLSLVRRVSLGSKDSTHIP